MDFERPSKPFTIPPWVDLVWGAALTVLWVLIAARLCSSLLPILVLATLLFSGICFAVVTHWPNNDDFGWANRVTLLRGSLIITLVAAAPFTAVQSSSEHTLWAYAIGALVALILDGVDGAIARITHSASKFGARFDMEMDALLILALCIAVFMSGKAGFWVLALGLMRYLFVAAASAVQWLNRPLPESWRRKTICVWQIVTLVVAVLPPIPPTFTSLTLATALLLLVWSFLTDVYWLYERRFHHETV